MEDKKDRFKNLGFALEYRQTKIRRGKLHDILIRNNAKQERL